MGENVHNLWQNAEIAKGYLSGVRLGFPYTTQQIEIVFHLIENSNLEIKNFLDLGCGDGFLGALLLSTFHGANGTFIDFSDEMLKAVQRNLRSYQDRFRIFKIDLSETNLVSKTMGDRHVDLVVSSLSIHHLENKNKQNVYKQVFDLLTENGLFINIEHVKPASSWVELNNRKLFYKSVQQFFQQQNPRFTIEDAKKELAKHAHPSQNKLESVEEQMKWLDEIGFVDVDCYFKVFEIAIFGGRKMQAIG